MVTSPFVDRRVSPPYAVIARVTFGVIADGFSGLRVAGTEQQSLMQDGSSTKPTKRSACKRNHQSKFTKKVMYIVPVQQCVQFRGVLWLSLDWKTSFGNNEFWRN